MLGFGSNYAEVLNRIKKKTSLTPKKGNNPVHFGTCSFPKGKTTGSKMDEV